MSSALAFVLLMTLLAMTSHMSSASSSSSQNMESPEIPRLEDLMSLQESRLQKRSLRDALQQHFALLAEAEQDILQRIEALKAKRQAISQRKRSHYMCLVNLIACYK